MREGVWEVGGVAVRFGVYVVNVRNTVVRDAAVRDDHKPFKDDLHHRPEPYAAANQICGSERLVDSRTSENASGFRFAVRYIVTKLVA